ncbi:MAG: DUF2141 domain-containing protein [Rhodomicrobium sp.]
MKTLGFIAASLFAGFSSLSCAAADLTITVDNLRSNQGQILLCVFSAESSDSAQFPDCTKGRPVRSANAIISGSKASVTFKGLKDGIYAVAAIHDENGNGQLDTNFIGIPTEGIAISNNPRLFGKPSFEQGRFDINGNTSINIEAKYIL